MALKFFKNHVNTESNFKKYKQNLVSVNGGIQFTCDWCDKTYTQLKTLRRHQASTHEGVRYECDKCDLQFTRKDSLSEHTKKSSQFVTLIWYKT